MTKNRCGVGAIPDNLREVSKAHDRLVEFCNSIPECGGAEWWRKRNVVNSMLRVANRYAKKLLKFQSEQETLLQEFDYYTSTLQDLNKLENETRKYKN